MRPLMTLLAFAVMAALWLVACGSEERPPQAAQPAGEQSEGEQARGEQSQYLPIPGRAVFTRGVDIWIHDAEGERLLIEAAEGQQLLTPALAPDGQRIAFVIFQLTSGEGFHVGASLALYDPSTASADPLTMLLRHEEAGEYHWNPRWSADGNALVYTHEAPALQIRVELLDLNQNRASVLRSNARSGALSPDGNRLVLIADPYGGDPRIAIQDLTSGEEILLDPTGEWEPRPYRIPRWTPDGRGIVFAAGQALPQISAAPALGISNGPEDIWHVDIETRQLTLLAAVGEDQPEFAVSSDGRHVLILGAFGLYLAAIPPTDPPYAIAPGEFHGGIDWIGAVSDEQWQAIRDSVLQGAVQ